MRLKRWLRHGLDAAALASGVLRRLERRAGSGVTILTYHRVLEDAVAAEYPLSALALGRSRLEWQARWLAGNATVLPVREALGSEGPPRDGRPVVCLTFDDGYFDNSEIAAPILESHGLRATFFVTTRFVEGGWMMWSDRAMLHWTVASSSCLDVARRAGIRTPEIDAVKTLGAWMSYVKRCGPANRATLLGELDRVNDLSGFADAYRAMTVDQVRRLHEHGHEVASHTRTHELLPQASDTDLDEELTAARASICEWTGTDVPGFCYPNGDYDDRSAAAVRRAGHTYALTLDAGTNLAGADRMRLRRRFIHADGTSDPSGLPDALAFRSELAGLHDRYRGRE